MTNYLGANTGSKNLLPARASGPNKRPTISGHKKFMSVWEWLRKLRAVHRCYLSLGNNPNLASGNNFADQLDELYTAVTYFFSTIFGKNKALVIALQAGNVFVFSNSLLIKDTKL